MKDILNCLNYILEVCISLYDCNFILCENSSRDTELEENLLKFCDNSDEDMLNSKKLYPIFEDT
jgi:hypothetical protein